MESHITQTQLEICPETKEDLYAHFWQSFLSSFLLSRTLPSKFQSSISTELWSLFAPPIGTANLCVDPLPGAEVCLESAPRHKAEANGSLPHACPYSQSYPCSCEQLFHIIFTVLWQEDKSYTCYSVVTRTRIWNLLIIWDSTRDFSYPLTQ